MAGESQARDEALLLDDVRKHFVLGGARIDVLRGATLRLAAGDCVAVTGPSGSGKTTLLHVAAGLEVPDAGTVRVAGVDPYRVDESARAALRRDRFGFVFQQHHLLPQLTALENVLLPALAVRPRATDDDVARARALLDDVGLGDRDGHRPEQLSGGERQRVAVARALMNRPAVILADEPTAALDRKTADEVAALLVRLARGTRTAVLVATHDVALAAAMDRRLELRDGVLRPA